MMHAYVKVKCTEFDSATSLSIIQFGAHPSVALFHGLIEYEAGKQAGPLPDTKPERARVSVS